MCVCVCVCMRERKRVCVCVCTIFALLKSSTASTVSVGCSSTCINLKNGVRRMKISRIDYGVSNMGM